MKIIQISVRTPGIFLGKDSPNLSGEVPQLSMEVRKEGTPNWMSVNNTESGVRIVSSTLGVFSGSLETGSVQVPNQEDGTRVFNLLVPDQTSWEYRILAKPCLDCERLFSQQGKADRILQDGSVIVGTGSIQS